MKTNILILAAVLLSADAMAGMVARWSGDGTTDESVAGNNATLLNGTGYESGKVGQAFSLDGEDDSLSVADNDAWTFGSASFTISLWANFDAVNAGPDTLLPNVFIAHDQGGGNNNKWVFYSGEDNKLKFLVNNTVSGQNFLSSESAIESPVGGWHHFAVTRSGNTFTFYADGVSLGTANSSLSIGDVSEPLTIGQSEGLGYFDGGLDEIRIYDEALSSEQIGQLAIPEPATFAFLGLFGGGLLAIRRIFSM